jgi:DNA-directed RNA polymerase subunit N (RpoN/RPB10)
MTRTAAERDLQKETINKVFEDLGVDKKVIRRMAKAYYKANFNEEIEENKNFEEMYDVVMKTLP